MLHYTEQEKNAIKIYIGQGSGDTQISNNSNIYNTMNALLFPGIDNELARIVLENKSMYSSVFNSLYELIDIYLNLYSAMYKFGKNNLDYIRTTRMDRTQSYPAMMEKRETVSFYSTSKDNEPLKTFKKSSPAVARVLIEPGASCIDAKKVLHGEYLYLNEQEVLVAPFCPIECERIKTDKTGAEVYEVKVKRQPKAMPLSKEEQKDKEECMKLLFDEEEVAFAKSFFEKLLSLSGCSTIEEALLQLDENDIQRYSKWKEALVRFFRYRAREISLELDRKSDELEESDEMDEIEEEENQETSSNQKLGKLEIGSLVSDQKMLNLVKIKENIEDCFDNPKENDDYFKYV